MNFLIQIIIVVFLIYIVLKIQRKTNIKRKVIKWQILGILLIWCILNVTLLAPNYDFVVDSALGYIKNESNIWFDENSNQVSCKGIMKSGIKYIVKCSMHDKRLKDVFGDVLYYGMVTKGEKWQMFYADTDLEKVKEALEEQTDMY